MSNANWNNDAIQFPKLLAEIMATQALDLPALAASMDLEIDEINALFDRANAAWEAIKAGDAIERPAAAISVSDWRVQDGSRDELPELLARPGKLSLSQNGYGAILDGVTPDDRIFSVGIEFDAGACKLMIFPPAGDAPTEATRDEFVVRLTIQNDAAIVDNGYVNGRPMRYEPEGRSAPCAAYDGYAALAAIAGIR